MINSPKINEIDIGSLTRFIWKKVLKHNFFFKINFIMSIILGLLFYYYLSNENKYLISKFKLKNLDQISADFNLPDLYLVTNPPDNFTFNHIFKKNISLTENFFLYNQELKFKNIKKLFEVKIYIDDDVYSFRHTFDVSDDLLESYIYFIGRISYTQYKTNYIIMLNNLIDHYSIALNISNSENFISDSDSKKLKKAIEFFNFKKEKILSSEFKNNIIEKKFLKSIVDNNNIFLSFLLSLGFFVFIIYIFFFIKFNSQKKN